MSKAFETAKSLIAATPKSEDSSSRGRATVSILNAAGIDKSGPWARKIMNALAAAGILNRIDSAYSRGFRWVRLIDEPTDNMINSAIATLSSGKRKSSGGSKTSSDVIRRLERLEAAASTGQIEIVIKTNKTEVTLPKGSIVPECFEQVVTLAECRMPIMLVGPAGCGKTYLGELVAKSLGLDFSAISCTAGMNESHLVGRSVPNITDGSSQFVSTDFLEAYEQGGVFLLDEMDAADSNLLLILNTAIANGYLSVPSRPEKPIANMHKDFVLICSANTFGRGADRMYVGRCQLDEASLDRFRMGTVEMDYDKRVESGIAPHEILLNVCWQIREHIATNKLRRLMSTRFIKNSYTMMTKGGWTIEQVVNVFFQGWTADERAKCEPKIPRSSEEAKAQEHGDDGQVDPEKLKQVPFATDTQRSNLDLLRVTPHGVSAKQTRFAQNIVQYWLSEAGLGNEAPVISELQKMIADNGNQSASKVIRWFKMDYVPGSSK
jgi:cobaltochelatase CobS